MLVNDFQKIRRKQSKEKKTYRFADQENKWILGEWDVEVQQVGLGMFLCAFEDLVRECDVLPFEAIFPCWDLWEQFAQILIQSQDPEVTLMRPNFLLL